MSNLQAPDDSKSETGNQTGAAQRMRHRGQQMEIRNEVEDRDGCRQSTEKEEVRQSDRNGRHPVHTLCYDSKLIRSFLAIGQGGRLGKRLHTCKVSIPKPPC